MELASVIKGSGSRCEDRLGVFHESVGTVLVVADGAGGMSGGAEAADLAVRLVHQEAYTLRTADACCKLLYRVDRELSKQPQGGQTTCVLVVVSQVEVYGASVGDSAAWIIGDTSFRNLTEKQIRKPFVGSGVAVPTPFTCERFPAKLLLASDGLVKYTSAERIIEGVTHADVHNGLQALVQLVTYPSGALPDDVAIILADLKA